MTRSQFDNVRQYDSVKQQIRVRYDNGNEGRIVAVDRTALEVFVVYDNGDDGWMYYGLLEIIPDVEKIDPSPLPD